MTRQIDELIRRISELEDELEQEFVKKREAFQYMIERFNCFYCSYGNGLAGYFREIAARTEQYWCPIKNGRRIVASHSRYPRFFEYGDAESYRRELAQLRAELMDQEAKQ
ncbi:hypothetical protein [uncultured Thiodictyon sp.]|jgi:hypothetical protein|uniref:hypothetical protein n=1 Tax=uncultured Thiodictyon sp. TaxID=1846217 RepID=UPI0025E8D4FB|nr:hypothetical protein [uncultured Thiodictyon sp.]